MGTLVSILLVTIAFLSVAAVLYFVVTEKVEHEGAADHAAAPTVTPEPTAEPSSDEAQA
jgi:predicted cobalt transporter CbtA